MQLFHGDCRDVIKTLPACSVDSVVTDPPYGLAFMGKAWDRADTPAFDPAFWAEVLRVLKPGGHLLAFGGTRTYHRLACAIEDAGFEIRDQIGWLYGSGFPKSHNVAVAIDKANGIGPRGKAFNMKGRGDRAEELDANGREFLPPYEAQTDAAQQWQGWGTALKPAWEPIVLARKPFKGTVAANVLEHGTGALNIDGCRVAPQELDDFGRSPLRADGSRSSSRGGQSGLNGLNDAATSTPAGRWPANVIHDGSEEVLAEFAKYGESKSQPHGGDGKPLDTRGAGWGFKRTPGGFDDRGTPARFFYSAKAGQKDRRGSKHPTVKPISLLRYLCRLITPPGGVVLDPFAGSGTTGEAAIEEGFVPWLIEREDEYFADIQRRMQEVVFAA